MIWSVPVHARGPTLYSRLAGCCHSSSLSRDVLWWLRHSVRQGCRHLWRHRVKLMGLDRTLSQSVCLSVEECSPLQVLNNCAKYSKSLLICDFIFLVRKEWIFNPSILLSFILFFFYFREVCLQKLEYSIHNYLLLSVYIIFVMRNHLPYLKVAQKGQT